MIEHLAIRILNYLYTDIAAHGGSGRRLSKIRQHVGMPNEDTFREAIAHLVTTERIRLEKIDNYYFTFIYAIPTGEKGTYEIESHTT